MTDIALLIGILVKTLSQVAYNQNNYTIMETFMRMISVYVMNTIKYVFMIINQIHKTFDHMTDEAYYYNFKCYMDNNYIIIQHDVYEDKVLTDTEKAVNIALFYMVIAVPILFFHLVTTAITLIFISTFVNISLTSISIVVTAITIIFSVLYYLISKRVEVRLKEV